MNNTKTIAEIFNNLNDVQKEVAYEIIDKALIFFLVTTIEKLQSCLTSKKMQ